MRWVAVLALVLPLHVQAAEWRDSAEVKALFEEAKVQGTFVLYDVGREQWIGHDRARAEQRFVPASTFKIPHTLIGLETGAVASVDEVLPAGPGPKRFPEWARDMSLREAIQVSAVPIYQSLARRIGLERMREQLVRLDYGNHEVGSRVDAFWLEGPLAISALEQVRFLARLATGRLPAPEALQAVAREVIRLESRDGRTLYGKTGWENVPEPGIGWWVGWVESDAGVFPFALNMAMRSDADAPLRVELGKASLRALGVW